MNTASKTILIAVSCLALSACASTSAALAGSAGHNSDHYDKQYVAKVERASRVRGVKVVWISPPTAEALATSE